MIAPGHTPKAKPSNKIHPSAENPTGRRNVDKVLKITPQMMKVLMRPERSVSQPPSSIDPMDIQEIRLTNIPALAISMPFETRKAGVNPNMTMKPALGSPHTIPAEMIRISSRVDIVQRDERVVTF